MRDTVIASLLSVPLPLSPRPNFLPQLVSRGDFKRGMKFGQPAATACSGGENVHGEEKKLAGRNSLNSRNDRRRRPGVRGSPARCIRRKSNGILEPRGRGTDVRVRGICRPTDRARACRSPRVVADGSHGIRSSDEREGEILTWDGDVVVLTFECRPKRSATFLCMGPRERTNS